MCSLVQSEVIILAMQIVGKFLLDHWDKKSPLLLGYSGGPDSKALLYSLLEAGCHSLHVAHVDHGWREESAEEAKLIEKEMASLGLVYHTIRLSPSVSTNKEEKAREERLSYFRSLFKKTAYQGLLVGHQADDLAETVLKRLLEGAHLSFLGAMSSISEWKGMPIWRPLLKGRREEIRRFLKGKGLTPFYDPTNRDPRFLRARMREETLPFLNRSFGKDVVNNLIFLSDRSQELKNYLDHRVAGRFAKRGSWGFAMDCRGLHRVEQRHLLKKSALDEGVILPRTVLEPMLDWLATDKLHRKIFFQKRWIVAYKNWVFFLNSDGEKTLPEKGKIRKLLISFAANGSE